jgi:hypothetical protein
MMLDRQYTIRAMSRPEVEFAVDWAASEGWNPGLYDARCFYAADPEGFLIGLLGDEPVACISVVKYGAFFGFLGFYIVKPEYRGMGYGLGIWNAGLTRLQGRTVGLDGVIAQQKNYKKSGFTLAYRNIRYQGNGGGRDVPHDSSIVKLREIPFEDVNYYDKPFFPDDRKAFLRCWIDQKESTALGVMQKGKLSGYGVIRPCRKGYKIGPLFSDTPLIAEKLFLALKATTSVDEPIFLDIPETNKEALDMVNHHKMNVVFETARMYTGEIPNLPVQKIFGVTTFELG